MHCNLMAIDSCPPSPEALRGTQHLMQDQIGFHDTLFSAPNRCDVPHEHTWIAIACFQRLVSPAEEK